MTLLKKRRQNSNCEFPNWVLNQWQIIPRGGMRALPQNSAPKPRQVTFKDKSSFLLASELVCKWTFYKYYFGFLFRSDIDLIE